MSAQVEALPATYKGRAFLRRWAAIGDVKTAAEDVRLSRWHARRVHERFIAMLKRKGVLRP
jgi:predicted metal-dependent phosphotriesterase family hydrolase